MSDQMNPMGPVEPEIMPQGTENVIGLPPGQSDREGAMSKADLYKIANYSHKLFKQINDDDQMEAWVQAKITKAADYIASVYHYLEYEMKFSEYGKALEDSGMYTESQKRVINNRLMEAKFKVKELKKVHAEKIKADADDKISEGILSGGHRECTECGGSGMVYEEPKAVPDHVKGKVEKYNRQAKAFHAASKRIDRNNNGIPDDEEIDEDFDSDDKVGSTKKTATGELTKTDTGVKHKNTSYKDDGDEIAANAKSGKGKASHAKAQSAAEKKDRAPAQKQSPKSAKTWGMKDSEKFDNRDGAPAKPKKQKEDDLDESLKGGQKKLDKNHNGKLDGDDFKQLRAGKVKEDVSTDKKPCPPMSHIKKMCQDGKSVAEICKMHPNCDQKELKQMVADCKSKLGEASMPMKKVNGKSVPAFAADGKGKNDLSKKKDVKEAGDKTAAVAMWNNIKETQAYIAEKSAVAKKDKPTKGNDVADEGNEFSGELAKAKASGSKEFKVDGKTFPVKESADLDRMKQFLTRLNG